MMRRAFAVLAFLPFASPIVAAEPIVLEQVISRHDPHFDVATARLSVGRDGCIYLANGGKSGGYVLRVSVDGRERSGGVVGYSTLAAAANRAGTIATAEGHFAHRVALWSNSFAPIGQAADFLVSDALQWNAPSDVVAGRSGDFYALDQHRLRVLRISAQGEFSAAYSLEALGEKSKGGTVGLRVDEERKRFVTAWPKGPIWVSSFEGKPLWSIELRPAGEPPGAFDLGPDGRLWVCAGGSDVKIYDLDGQLAGERKLNVAAGRKAQPIHDLRILGERLFMKRSDPTTLFEVFDTSSGEMLSSVAADVEKLTARFPTPVWLAGKAVPFTLEFDAGLRGTKPTFRIWARPLGVPEFAELALANGVLAIPKDYRGLYQIRVTPDIGGRVSEYVLDGFVEVRVPEAVGSASIFTPANRFYYGCGEEIPIAVSVCAASGTQLPGRLTLQLRSNQTVLLQWPLEFKEGKAEFRLSSQVTASLTPGRYTLDADLPGFTVAPQFIEIGPGIGKRPKFHIVQHGDYALGFPAGPRPGPAGVPRLSDSPDVVADHLARSRKLHVNLFVDRLGSPSSGLGLLSEIAKDDQLLRRLKADPLAVSPEKAQFEGSVRRSIAGYGAYGIEEQSILLYMDAGLPLGTLHDSRKPERMEQDVRTASEKLLPYPAFRGWSWAANWWLEKHSAAAAEDATERGAYEAALKKAKDVGEWSPVLDAVSDRTFAHAVVAERRFRKAMNEVAPGKLSAITGPYRAIQTHPPIAFANADEVDLHYQAEQIQPPQATPHHVDYYRRPGKPAWGHPELWNDDGTGGAIFPALMQMAMRGANGVGQSGPIGPWASRDLGQSDPRSAAAGTTSAYRAIYGLLEKFGPWLATLENADRIVIPVSTRMVRIEDWDGKIGSAYFDSLFEAYSSCLYAHRPASFAFAEDLQPDSLKKYKAILLVDQRVELDPSLATAIANAREAGVQVFHDETCREELVRGFSPLGVAFDKVRQDPSAWQDDAAYYRFPRYFKAHAERLLKVLGSAVKPVAECSNPEIMLTERKSGAARFIWAVNNTMLDWEPGLAWRLTLLMAQRVPVLEALRIDVPEGWVVYDVFASHQIEHKKGVISCDLRSWPAKLFAVIPYPIRSLDFDVPSDAQPVLDRKHEAMVAAVDLHFGPHIRDLAVSTDGKEALLNAFNWDHNLYGLDVESGSTRWRTKVGHGFAFDPIATSQGFAVQGFDVFSAEGYHLYALGKDGKPAARYALFGLPKRATSWASGSQLQDVGIDNFASAPDGSWIASAGDLGLVVWDRAGMELWADEWWKGSRKRVRLIAQDDETLVSLDGTMATAREARTGKQLWSIDAGSSGDLIGGIVSADRKTLILRSTALGGRLTIVRGGKLCNTILSSAGEVSVAADGSLIAATDCRQLKVFDPLAGLLWTFTGDDTLRHPRISHDRQLIAVGSELGTLSVLAREGRIVAQHDLGSLPVASWLPGGDLLIATWMGEVRRTNARLSELRWLKHLEPTETDIRSKLLAKDSTPTFRKSGWGNATSVPLPLTPNLLAETKAIVGARHEPRTHGDPRTWQNPIGLLTDGKPDAPPKPWLPWTDIGFIDSGWRERLTLEIDTFRTQLRARGITFAEDPAHPESWLRDVRLQWWDASTERWQNGPYLLADSALHSHVFDKPISAAKFRLASTGGGTWPVGNIRLGEVVLHGEVLGCSHPDAIARNPVAVLFDEKEADLQSLKAPGRPFGLRHDGAFSGGKCLELSAAGEAGPAWQPPFGHALPNWDFEIVEVPRPGQYRYLQFAWKATSKDTTGMGLLLGLAWPSGGVAALVGDAKWKEGIACEHRIAGKPPTEWTTVRIDLWAAAKGKPLRIQALNLTAVGGGALFDQIVLGRTMADLDRVARIER